MNRQLLVLTVLFACVFLGYSTTVAQGIDCYMFLSPPWECSTYYTGEPNKDCVQNSSCSEPDMMGNRTCLTFSSTKRGPNYFGYHNHVAPIATGFPLSSSTHFITCVDVYYCQTNCIDDMMLGPKCANLFSMPFGGMNYLLGSPQCMPMP